MSKRPITPSAKPVKKNLVLVKKRKPKQPKMSLSKTPFLNALLYPFNPESMGTRVPDPFCFPTSTYHSHQTVVCGTGGGTSTGSVVFLPNPVLSTIDMQQLHYGVASKSIYSTPQPQLNATASTVGSSCYGANGPTALANLLSTYRVVSWGIKISNLQPELTATGRIIVATIPISDTVPSYNEFAANTTTNEDTIRAVVGLPATYFNAQLLNLPSATEFAVQDLLHGDVEISGVYTNSSFWQFKSTVTGVTEGTNTYGNDSSSINTTLNTFSAFGYKDITRMAGGCGICVYYEGVPVSSNNAFQVEVIYHYEGSPQLATGTAATPVPSCAEAIVVGTSVAVENSMSIASRMSNALKFVSKGANFLSEHKDSITKGISLMANAASFVAKLA